MVEMRSIIALLLPQLDTKLRISRLFEINWRFWHLQLIFLKMN